MELYLIRHGLAAEPGETYPDDGKRPLTHDGIEKLGREAAALAALDITFDCILTSPLVRARQTAEALAQGLAGPPPIHNVEALAPGGSFAAVVEAIAKHARRTRVALVGHEPEIGELAARLIGTRAPMPFKKGAICRIDLETVPPAGPGVLRWFATPKMLRRLGNR